MTTQEKFAMLGDIRYDITNLDDSDFDSLLRNDVDAKATMRILRSWATFSDEVYEQYGAEYLANFITDESLDNLANLVNSVHEAIFGEINYRLGVITLEDYE